MRVADIRAEECPFIFDFTARVGDEGRVFGVELAPKFVERLTAEAKARDSHKSKGSWPTTKDS